MDCTHTDIVIEYDHGDCIFLFRNMDRYLHSVGLGALELNAIHLHVCDVAQTPQIFPLNTGSSGFKLTVGAVISQSQLV